LYFVYLISPKVILNSTKLKFLIITLTLIPSLIFAQNRGQISGQVIDNDAEEPVPFATISLKGISDTTFFTGSLTGTSGEFNISNIPDGEFNLAVTFIGYQKHTQTVSLNKGNRQINLQPIRILQATEQLKEFEVTAKKADMMIAIDRKVFNVADNPIIEGGNAMDALRQIPTLIVDGEGNVSLRGSENIQIFINGRPSGINADNLQQVLEGLPANSIENVEIITNPSAKYDADGMAGIINIITKKNLETGKFGSITAGVGTRNKYNLGGSYNFGTKKLKGLISLNTQYQEFFSFGTTERDNFFENQPVNSINTFRNGKNGRTNINLTGNLNYEFSEKTSLAVNYVLGYNNRWRRDTIRYNFIEDFVNPIGERYREGQENQNAFNTDIGISLTHKFKSTENKKNEISFGQNISNFQRDRDQNFWEQDQPILNGYVEQPFRERVNNTQNNTVSITQIDYEKDFKSLKFETGAKLNIRDLRNGIEADTLNYQTGSFDNNINLTNQFDYIEYVSAAYLNINGEFGGFGYQAGLRAEQTNININQPQTNQQLNRSYFDFFPSAFLSKKLENEIELQLNYTRRINRPGPWALNPFPNLIDPLNIRTGNPLLNPEYINSYEFSTIKYWANNSLTLSLFHRETLNAIQRITFVNSNGVANNTRENIGKAQNTGAELILRNEITKWWDNTFNLNVFRNILEGGGLENNLATDAINWNFRIISNIKLPRDFNLQITGFYLAPVNTPQGQWVGYYHIDFGLKKDILKGRGTLVLNVLDAFDIRQYEIQTQDTNFSNRSQYKWESQYAMLNFTYRIGTPGKNERKPSTDRGNQTSPNLDF
jgi:iron complex outermembrane receptor protein